MLEILALICAVAICVVVGLVAGVLGALPFVVGAAIVSGRCAEEERGE